MRIANAGFVADADLMRSRRSAASALGGLGGVVGMVSLSFAAAATGRSDGARGGRGAAFTSSTTFGHWWCLSRFGRVCDQRAAVGVAKQVSALYMVVSCAPLASALAQRGLAKAAAPHKRLERHSGSSSAQRCSSCLEARLCALPTLPGVSMLPSVLQR